MYKISTKKIPGVNVSYAIFKCDEGVVVIILKFHFRLDIKSVGKDFVEFLYEKNSIKEISRVEIWSNLSKAWLDTEWELVPNDDHAESVQVVRLTPKTDHEFDIRVVAIENDDTIKIFTKCEIKLLG